MALLVAVPSLVQEFLHDTGTAGKKKSLLKIGLFELGGNQGPHCTWTVGLPGFFSSKTPLPHALDKEIASIVPRFILHFQFELLLPPA